MQQCWSLEGAHAHGMRAWSSETREVQGCIQRPPMPEAECVRLQSERVTSFISVKTKDNDTVRAGLLVLSDRLSHLLQRLRDSPLSTRNARSHKASTEQAKI